MSRTPEEISARHKEALGDYAFMTWLLTYEPDWQQEHSGTIVGLFDAWQAGAEHGRLDDMSNNDHE